MTYGFFHLRVRAASKGSARASGRQPTNIAGFLEALDSQGAEGTIMGCRSRLIDLLETQRVAYETHPPAASGTQATGLPGACNIEVLFLPDNRPAMFVVPSHASLDLRAARRVLGRQNVRPAREDELAQLFPDCDAGAIPAFGNWYGVPVFLDIELAEQRQITFSTGVRGESITIPTAILERFARSVRAWLVDRILPIPA